MDKHQHELQLRKKIRDFVVFTGGRMAAIKQYVGITGLKGLLLDDLVWRQRICKGFNF